MMPWTPWWSLSLALGLTACELGPVEEDEADPIYGGPGDYSVADIDVPAEELPPLVPGAQLGEPWSKLCVARFTRDFRAFIGGELQLEARRGDEYLIAELYEDRNFTLLVPAPGGVKHEYVALAGEPVPFETRCVLGDTDVHVAIFDDVVLYEDAALTRAICALERGTMLFDDAWSEDRNVARGLEFVDVRDWPEPCFGHSDAFFATPGGVYPVHAVLAPRTR